MKKFSFVKLSGAGNDFILFDKNLTPELNFTPELIQKICKRRMGIGADGILVISDEEGYDFKMEYFNSDGSTGSLCGNGARCAIRYADESGRIKSEKVNFVCNGFSFSGEKLEDGLIKFFPGEPKSIKKHFKIMAAGQLINSSYVDTGSPHVVIKVQDVLQKPEDVRSFYSSVDNFPVYDLGKEIRYAPEFAPHGVNVNFVDVCDDLLKIRTYERGVEDETLACGTGSIAAALISYFDFGVEPPVKLLTKSGEILIVDFEFAGLSVSNISLSGPAKIIFKGEFFI